MESANMKTKILNLIYDIIDDLNLSLSDDNKISKTPETTLYGDTHALDSLGLVNLIVGTEQIIQDELGISITIVNERALSEKHSPFRTVDTLSDYILTLINE